MATLATDPRSTSQVNSCLKDLYKLIKQVEDARKATEPTLDTVSATNRKIRSDQKISPSTKNKLKSLYEESVKEANKVRKFMRAY